MDTKPLNAGLQRQSIPQGTAPQANVSANTVTRLAQEDLSGYKESRLKKLLADPQIRKILTYIAIGAIVLLLAVVTVKAVSGSKTTDANSSGMLLGM